LSACGLLSAAAVAILLNEEVANCVELTSTARSMKLSRASISNALLSCTYETKVTPGVTSSTWLSRPEAERSDKLAYVDWLKLRGSAPALCTPALAGTPDFRNGLHCDGQLRWRSANAMMAFYQANTHGGVGAAETKLATVGLALFRSGRGTTAAVQMPFYMSPNLDAFRNAGALRMWSCYIHQSNLGIVTHLLTKMARSLTPHVLKHLNDLLEAMPAQHGVPHVKHGLGLFKLVKSQKDNYYNAMLVVMSAAQKLAAATQLAAILDHVDGDAHEFADAFGAFLMVDELMRDGKLADAGAVYRESFLPALRRAPFKFPPTNRYKNLDINDAVAVETARFMLFADLPKQADFAAAFIINAYCGGSDWTTTAGGDVAHQRTKNSVLRHSTFAPEAANVSSLLRNARADAAHSGFSNALVAIESQRIRQRRSALLSFVDAGASFAPMPDAIGALLPDGSANVSAQLSKLRIQYNGGAASLTVGASNTERPTFVRLRVAGGAADGVMFEVTHIVRVLANTPDEPRFVLHAVVGTEFLILPPSEQQSARPWAYLQSTGIHQAIAFESVLHAEVQYVCRHLSNRTIWFRTLKCLNVEQ
jgi:hypothetical protein